MKWFKRISIAIGVLIVLLVVAVVVIVATFDPNAYKQQITTAVKDATGRDLTLEGDISLSLFPWLGLELGKTSLSNAEGFGDAPFAAMDEVAVHVALLPLLRKEVRVDRLVLKGLDLNLARNAEGVSNWDDLAAKGEAGAEAEEAAPAPETPAPSGETGGLPVFLTVGGVEIVDARVSWRDAQAGTDIVVDPFNLRTGTLELGEPMDVALDLRTRLAEPALEIYAALETEAVVDPDAQQYAARDLVLEVTAEGEPVPSGEMSATLKGSAVADLAAETANLQDFSFETLGAKLSGAFQVTGLTTTPAVSGHLESNRFDLKSVLDALAVSLPLKKDASVLKSVDLSMDVVASPQAARVQNLVVNLDQIELQGSANAEGLDTDAPQVVARLKSNRFDARPYLEALEGEPVQTADPEVLSALDLEAELQATSDSASVRSLALGLDDTKIRATADVENFERPAIDFQMEVDAIDLDRYLPPVAEDEAAPAPAPVPTGGAEDTPIDLPVDMMRSLDVDGQITVGKLVAKKLNMSDIAATLSAHDGLLQVKPLGLKLYDGRIDTTAALDVRGDTPIYTAAPKIAGLQVGPLMDDFAGDRFVAGALDLSADVNTRGNTVPALSKALGGTARFKLMDASLRGSEMAEKIANAIRMLSQEAVSERSDKVDLGEVSASAVIKSGVVNNPDLLILANKFTGKGEGSVDLVQERIKYTLNLYQPGKNSEIPLPVRIKGPFTDLDYDIDQKAWLEAVAKKKLGDKIEKQKDKVDEQVEEKREELKEDLQKSLEKGLKNLFR